MTKTGPRVLASLTQILCLASTLIVSFSPTSGASQKEAVATDTSADTDFWSPDCPGSLVEDEVPTLHWEAISPEVKAALSHPAFGLVILEEWRDPEFLSLPQAQRFESYFQAWSSGRTKTHGWVTHHVMMPTKVLFERVVFDQGTGENILLPSGKIIQNPGFGGLGVAWRTLGSDKKPVHQPLLWSAPLPGEYTKAEAEAECLQRGGRLPTRAEYEDLIDQLGRFGDSQGRARFHNLLDFIKELYWTSGETVVSAMGFLHAYVLRVPEGHIASINVKSRRRVRCVAN